jgi:hypothetical protein
MFRPALTFVILFGLARPIAAADTVDFARDVLPILSDHCFRCHGPDENARKADLRFDLKEEALRKDLPVIVPGKPAESELFKRLIIDEPTERMPPPKANKPLKPEQIAVLKRWIEQGAPWGQHWAFGQPQRPEIPGTKHQPRNPIDSFIFARLEKEGMKPASEADKERLIRRVTLDLSGLPPTPEEVDTFLNDKSPLAYEKVVDRLLASQRFGERMAWDWLDAARYADSNGYQGDNERTMWPWRDWVVNAFNQNMPYDQFTIWQLAGDLLPNPSREQILATGFNRNHMINGEGGRIPEENRIEYVFDQTETTGTVWLGLTFTCARCHDHKFDPISQAEYYSLFAFFNQTPVTGSGGSGQTAPVIDFGTPEQEAKRKTTQAAYDVLVKQVQPIEKRLREAGMSKDKDGKYATTLPQLIESALRKGPNDRADQNYDELIKHYQETEPEYVKLLGELRKARRERDAAVQSVPKVMVMADMAKPRDTFILTRGTYDKPADKVLPALPTFQAGMMAATDTRKPQNRLDLAKWIVASENPLTARVTVNRLWQQFFGIGLVKTTEDFGVQSERPSHPDLLDWLAVEFVNPTKPAETVPWAMAGSPWDIKRFVRLIVTSTTYRQSSKVSPELQERDPENRLLARGPRHRLPSWMIRDQALAASGLLTPSIGGPPVKPYQPPGIWEEATFGNKRYQQDKGEALYRRSIYVFWRRIVGPTMLFDSANRQTCSVKSVTTNTPLHALATLNDITYIEAARTLAQKAIEHGGGTEAQRLAFAFRRATCRAPTEQELKILQEALEKQRAIYASDRDGAVKLLKVGESPRNEKLDVAEHAALTVVCSLILNLDEVLTKQ